MWWLLGILAWLSLVGIALVLVRAGDQEDKLMGRDDEDGSGCGATGRAPCSMQDGRRRRNER